MRDNIKVLIYDEYEQIRVYLDRVFKKSGCQTFLAGSETQALEIFHNEKPEICVLDLYSLDSPSFSEEHRAQIEFCPGIRVLKTIKETDPQAICLILTRDIKTKDRREAKRLGAYGFIHKPWEFEPMRALIAQAIEAAKSQQGE